MNICALLSNGPAAPFAPELLSALEQLERELPELCAGAGELEAPLRCAVTSGGKRLRPLLAFTCWRLSGSRMPIMPLMLMLEMMHTSSLIHDDLVDRAGLRRGRPTIYAERGGLDALRAGDFLLARAMEKLVFYRGTGINEALSAVAQEMCLGEIEQRGGLFRLSGTTEADYYRRIGRKTALLMAESCRSGAVAGGASGEIAAALREYGFELGLAFQLRDDLLDYAESTGKSPMQDLRSGVVTLPLIYASEMDGEIAAIAEKREKTPEDIRRVIRIMKGTGAFSLTASALKEHGCLAERALSPLPASAEKDSLVLLAQTISEVKKIARA